MVKKPGKPTSKRTPVRLRHKIEKASAAKQRKQRKLAKKNPEWRSRIKKDPGIPNLFPYKDRILQDVEQKKREKEEEQRRRQDELKATAKLAKKALSTADSEKIPEVDDPDSAESLIDYEAMSEGDGEVSNPMAALLASAKARAAEYEVQSDLDASSSDESAQSDIIPLNSSARTYASLFPTLLSQSDILLYVLDARDPLTTRSIPVERQIVAHAGGVKHLVLILNKIDLVPPSTLKHWLQYLRRFHPTLPLHASSPAPGAKTFSHGALTRTATSAALLRALKAHAARQNLRRALTVGVCGFPNVGKSSVVNALAGRRGRTDGPAPTGGEAGITTALRSVKLDNRLTLLDSPGVVYPEEEEEENKKEERGQGSLSGGRAAKNDLAARLALLGALPTHAVPDPIPAVALLLARAARAQAGTTALREHYGLAPFVTQGGDPTTDFLVQVARKRGRLGKGGVPNLDSAARVVLGDWRDGRIGGCVEGSGVLAMHGLDAGDPHMGDRKEVVDGWAREFVLEGLWGDDGAEVRDAGAKMEE